MFRLTRFVQVFHGRTWFLFNCMYLMHSYSIVEAVGPLYIQKHKTREEPLPIPQAYSGTASAPSAIISGVRRSSVYHLRATKSDIYILVS